MLRQSAGGIFVADADDLDIRHEDSCSLRCVCPLCVCRGRTPRATLVVNRLTYVGHCSRCGAQFVVHGPEGCGMSGVRQVGDIIAEELLNFKNTFRHEKEQQARFVHRKE